MATKAAAPIEAWEYILKCDRELPPEQQSRFRLRPLTLAERAAARDNLARTHVHDGERTVVSRSRQVAIELTLSNLVSAENFPAGEAMPWPADGTLAEKRAYLELLGDAAVNELGNEIFDRSIGATVAAKN